MTLNPGADASSWRTLFLLLARSPAKVRADGGIAKLWTTAGGPSLEIEEIDYAEVLREKQGREAARDEIVAAALAAPEAADRRQWHAPAGEDRSSAAEKSDEKDPEDCGRRIGRCADGSLPQHPARLVEWLGRNDPEKLQSALNFMA
jgi:hypothetical protein